MADYLTTDTELTSIANAIRTKGGTSASLVYPAGFVTAIENIPTGGGGNYQDKTVTPTATTQVIVPDTATILSLDVADVAFTMVYGEGTIPVPDAVVGKSYHIEGKLSPRLIIDPNNPHRPEITINGDATFTGSRVDLTSIATITDTTWWGDGLRWEPNKDIYFEITATWGAPVDVMEEFTVTEIGGTNYDALSSVTVLGDANLVAMNIKKDVSIFNIIGAYEGASLNFEYESGTYIPSANAARPQITWSNAHAQVPVLIAMADVSNTELTAYSNLSFIYCDYYKLFGSGISYPGSTRYAVISYISTGSSASSTTSGVLNCQYSSDYQAADNTNYSRYWATETDFHPYSNSTTRYWRSGRTYKWFAVWKP